MINSSVLIVAHPNPSLVSFGADFVPTMKEAISRLQSSKYSVLCFPVDLLSSEELTNLAKLSEDKLKAPQLIGIVNSQSYRALIETLQKINFFKIFESYDDASFEEVTRQALDEVLLVQQNAEIFVVIQEQNFKLTELSLELENRVAKRQKYLAKALEKLTEANRQTEALQRALIAVHRANSIGEMERLLNDALSAALGLSWTRILLKSQSHLESFFEKEKTIYAVHIEPLSSQSLTEGKICFGRKIEEPFRASEKEFLNQVSDTVALSVGRLMALRQAEEVKQQWEATFNAITVPVSITNQNYEIVRVNRAYAEHSNNTSEGVIGLKCHQVLFGKSVPCDNCTLGLPFRLQVKSPNTTTFHIYDVGSQKISSGTYVNIYRDLSNQLRYERQILESAKMAELGTVGSSIAHELNNPIGGVIAYLQLLKMDLKDTDPFYADVIDMEKAALRCKDIVQNLLSFTRKNDVENSDLSDILKRATEIFPTRK